MATGLEMGNRGALFYFSITLIQTTLARFRIRKAVEASCAYGMNHIQSAPFVSDQTRMEEK